MYIINKVVEDYEGTWSNALMYETDFKKAVEIVDQLQEAVVSLKRMYINFQNKVNEQLKQDYPNFGNSEVEFEDQIKSIDSNDLEFYFDKEDRLLKELTDKYLNEKEQFLYQRSNMKFSCKLMYFEVETLGISTEVFEKAKNNETVTKIEYSSKENAKEYSHLFESSID